MLEDKFWLKKSLAEMNNDEWEAICDGCGKCCLHTFIDSDEQDESFESTDVLREGEEIIYTAIVCRYLDTKKCFCTEYENRTSLVPSCVKLTKDNIDNIFFMPPSCSYRRLHEGRGLASWHPLLNNGSKAVMHRMGISVKGRVMKDNQIDMDLFEDYIADWPKEDHD
ncbi:YcgN family cysteine cluster protein [Pseudoalteromonas spongiae]|mgnify:FL=1|uniref:YcgN family cysteine cluster protein n=1 Tax=Pseudoalteromonas spongiae TaxID=298657 RepID=A0ABU8EYK3_9GAMM|nr:YcgN family cysteine cluster protein [Pseudoalteromonas spongiae]TMO84451.1 YcgN family cysteine cluster protein [Pseudoalteromonas spongiae]